MKKLIQLSRVFFTLPAQPTDPRTWSPEREDVEDMFLGLIDPDDGEAWKRGDAA